MIVKNDFEFRLTNEHMNSNQQFDYYSMVQRSTTLIQWFEVFNFK